MSDDFTLLKLGDEYKLFNIGAIRGLDSAIVFEALENNSGYTLNIYMSNMSQMEADLISTAPLNVRVMKDTPYFTLPIVRFGNSYLVFEIFFDPTAYKDNRAMQLALNNNMVHIVGIDSNTNIIKALRLASMPRKLRDVWVASWSAAMSEDNFSGRYSRWYQDISRRYSLMELWERATPVGQFGEE